MDVPAELMSKYLERRKHNLIDCYQALENQSFKEIEKIGHQMRGNGKTFGHPELSRIGKDLESAAQLEDLNRLESAISEFSYWMSSHTN